MKNSKIILPLFLVFTVLNSCNNYEGNHVNESATLSEAEDSIVPLSSTAATYQDSEREFVRTADLSMEVENVYKTTLSIESKAAELGGFVTKSNLNSRILENQSFPVSQDSAVEVKKYLVNNEMILRIPQKELGNFLNALSEEIEFLHFRNISADDVSLNLMLDELENNRLNQTNKKLDDTQQNAKKTLDRQKVIHNVNKNQQEINQNKITTLKLRDNVAFSTLSLYILEKEKIAQSMIINPKTYKTQFEPHFLFRVQNAVKEGFYFFQSILVAALYIWPLWLLGILIFIFVKFQIRKSI